MTVVHEQVTITVRPVAGHIGADISGVDIAGALAPETVRQLKDALHRYKVIFFRDQQLDHASQIAFGRQFGTLTYAHPHDEAPPDGYAEMIGDVPVGPDGRESELVAGRPFTDEHVVVVDD